MRRYEIRGGRALSGGVVLQGAKNSALPLMAASALCTEGKVCFENCPVLEDTSLTERILVSLGCGVTRKGGLMTVDPSGICRCSVCREYCAGMRSSILFLGPLLARFGRAEMFLPGGCLLGARPVDIHIKGLEKMGADVRVEGDRITAACPRGLRGAAIELPFPSVGATENMMTAASLAEGKTVIENAAAEPEIGDLADLINRMGGHVRADGGRITVFGVKRLHGCRKRIIPDRIAAFTFFAAALATNGNIMVRGADPAHLRAAMRALEKTGAAFEISEDGIGVRRALDRILPTEIVTAPYPGFPTDDMALAMALLTVADGVSSLRETVFSDRFALTDELLKMGADMTVRRNVALVTGVHRLRGAAVRATDLRAGAALIVAGLAAEGETLIEDDGHIARGYENIVGTLSALGADITEREN